MKAEEFLKTWKDGSMYLGEGDNTLYELLEDYAKSQLEAKRRLIKTLQEQASNLYNQMADLRQAKQHAEEENFDLIHRCENLRKADLLGLYEKDWDAKTLKEVTDYILNQQER